MTNKEIAELLQKNHQEFIDLIKGLKEEDFCYAPTDKWSAAQQLDHLVRSVQPVNMAIALPKMILQLLFGKANRPSKTYDELIAKYQNKIQEGAKASGRFIPPTVGLAQKENLLKRLGELVNSLSKKTSGQSEESLDKYILPHPLLGKLTLREMLYFTAYHVHHHQSIVERDLKNK